MIINREFFMKKWFFWLLYFLILSWAGVAAYGPNPFWDADSNTYNLGVFPVKIQSWLIVSGPAAFWKNTANTWFIIDASGYINASSWICMNGWCQSTWSWIATTWALALKAPIESPTFSGFPLTPTPLDSDAADMIASKWYVDAKIVSAAGAWANNCYYTTSPLCMNGYAKAPWQHSTYSWGVNNICCTLDTSIECSAFAPGAGCQWNTIYAFYYQGSHYATTPGNCDDYTTPFCDGNTDTLTKKWSSESVLRNATSTTDGSGNTALLAAFGASYPAAKYCADMVYGGYSDWFLPANSQLMQMYVNRSQIGWFDQSSNSDSDYWSSSENSSSNAMFISFYDGNATPRSKWFLQKIRCIRKIQ